MSSGRQGRLAMVTMLVVCVCLVGHDFYPKWARAKLARAIRRDDLGGVRAALACGADPNGLLEVGFGPGRGEKMTMLTLAAQSAAPSIYQTLLKAGAEINRRDPGGRTPLVRTIDREEIDRIQVLLDAGADVNESEVNPSDGMPLRTPMEAMIELPSDVLTERGKPASVSPLQQKIYRMLRAHGATPTLNQAIEMEDSEEVRALIRLGVQVNGNDPNDVPPLITAVSRRNDAYVNLLLENGADVNIKTPDSMTPIQATANFDYVNLALYHRLRAKGAVPDLVTAAYAGDTEAVTALLATGIQGVRVNIEAQALAAAVWKGHLDLVRLLLEHGADPNIRSSHNESPLTLASIRGRLDIAQALLDHGANVNVIQTTPFGSSVRALLVVVARNDVAMYRLFRRYQARVDLFAAVAMGDIEMVQSLLDRGMSVDVMINAPDTGVLVTPLLVAIRHHQPAMVDFLLAHHANVEIQSGIGETPLESATLNGQARIVTALIDHGASVNAVGKNGETALLKVAFTDHLDCLQILLAHGADLNVVGVGGQTALLRAVRANHGEIVRALVEKGADVNIRNARGETALSLATKQNLQPIVQLLKQTDAQL